MNKGCNKTDLIKSLKKHEGYRGRPYLCTAGKETIGYGCRLPISRPEAALILEYRVNKVRGRLEKRLSDIWQDLPKNVKEVLIEMAYQLGVRGLLKFKKTMVFVKAGDYLSASKEMLDSQWARRHGIRARRLSRKMKKIER